MINCLISQQCCDSENESCNMRVKNSKVFEQKGDLLNFKANIDAMALLSQAEPS